MADNDYPASAPSDQATSHGVGLLEPRHDAGSLVCLHGGESFLAKGLGRKEPAVRQQLRELYDAPRKRGAKRQALQVEPCFAPLLGLVVS